MSSNRSIAKSQLRLSTGKRINSAADDVAGYITSRSLNSRNVSLKAALNSVGEAKNVTSISQDALDNITNLLTQIKDAASQKLEHTDYTPAAVYTKWDEEKGEAEFYIGLLLLMRKICLAATMYHL